MAVQVMFFRAGERTLDLMRHDDGGYGVYERGAKSASCAVFDDALAVFRAHQDKISETVRKRETGL